MAIVSMKQLLDHACEHNYGHPAFNVSNMEQIHAVFKAAEEVNAPVIIQFSRSARGYASDTFITQLINAISLQYPNIPFAVHQDHGNSFATCATAMQTGFSSVMIDGSLEADGKTPSSFEYNADITKKVVELAHSLGVSVEGELGVLGSLETGMGDQEDGHGAEGVLSKDMLLTDPKEAAEFAKVTGVDALAVAIGTSHGAYKFTRKPTGDILAIDRIGEISKATGGLPLVMHGSSSVPKELQEMINQYGGNIPETWGVPIEEIQKAISMGVRKVNIDTDLRMAVTAGIRKHFVQNPSSFDPRAYLKESSAIMQDLCKSRFVEFGCEGKASSIKPVGLQDAVKKYYS